MSKKLYYALKRRSNGEYISPVGYSSFREQKEPHPFRRLATARQHRLRVFAFMAVKDDIIADDIDIEKLWMSVETIGVEEEDIAITAKIARFCKAIHARQTNARVNSNFFHDIGVVQFAEDLMRSSPKAANMRYIIHSETLISDSSYDIKLRDTVNLVRKGEVALIATGEDMAIFKLHQHEITFVYDVENDVFLD